MKPNPNQLVLIHCKKSVKDYINLLDVKFTETPTEVDILVNNIDELDDQEFCEHYNIDYDDVNCIEAYNYVA
tara:strand:- start:135 stop:350 length:216 start_codon:yes stop_codon:yes gene_type:complete